VAWSADVSGLGLVCDVPAGVLGSLLGPTGARPSLVGGAAGTGPGVALGGGVAAIGGGAAGCGAGCCGSAAGGGGASIVISMASCKWSMGLKGETSHSAAATAACKLSAIAIAAGDIWSDRT